MPSEPSPPRAASAVPAWRFAALSLIILLALALRLPGLARTSLWLDEAITLQTVAEAYRPSLGIGGTSPPLYTSLLWASMKLLPAGEAAARFPSLLLGVAAVPLLYLLGRRLLGRAAGLAAALFLAVSPFHVRYSQEARAYSLMLFLALLSWLLLLRALERRSAGRWLAWAAAAAGLGLSHNHALFLVAAQALYLLLQARRLGVRPWQLLAVFAAVGLACLPWLWALARTIPLLRQSGYWIARPGTGDLLRSYRLLSADSGWLMKVNLVLLAAGAAWWVLRRPARRSAGAALLLGIWLVVPLLLALLFSFTVLPIYQHRYTLALLPSVLLFTAWGAVGHGRRPLSLALAGLVVCLSTPGLVHYHAEPNRETWREAAAVVESLWRPGDWILVTSPEARTPFLHYFKLPGAGSQALSGDARWARQVGEAVARQAGEHRRLWAVVSHNRTRMLENSLERTCGRESLLAHWPMEGIDLYCYRTPDPNRPPPV